MTDPTAPVPPHGEPTPQETPVPPITPLAGAVNPGKPSRISPWLAGGITLTVALCCGGTAIAALTDDQDAEKPAAAATSVAPTSAAPTTAAPTTTAPTTAAPATTQAAPTTTPPAPKPKVIKGRGDDVVRVKDLTELSVVKFTCRCTSNTVLKSDGDGLLVNEIGSYSGKHWINLEDDSLTTQFEIEAAGSWTLTIGSVDQLASKFPTGTASGKGDDVLVLGGDAAAARITHRKGDSNFVVYAYSLETGEGGLLINEIGAYSGVRPLSAPALVQITADGNWTIAPA